MLSPNSNALRRRRSGWNSGGRKTSSEGGSMPSGVGSSRLRGLWEHRELPSGVRDGAPAENGFWRILKATETPFCTYIYMTKSGGGICISVPTLNSGGLVPRDLRPLCLGRLVTSLISLSVYCAIYGHRHDATSDSD